MSDRTFRLILDGKKGGLVKGSTPSSAAKKACKKLSAEQMKNSTVFHQLSLKNKVLKTEPGKTSFKFELQETTKDSKKKVYGPYKGSFVKDKLKVKMVGGSDSNSGKSNNSYINNIKKIIEDDDQLLELLLSNKNNDQSVNFFSESPPYKKYFNKEKYNWFIDFLSTYYSLEDQLKKLSSLQNKINFKIELIIDNNSQNSVIKELNEFYKMNKILHKKKSRL